MGVLWALAFKSLRLPDLAPTAACMPLDAFAVQLSSDATQDLLGLSSGVARKSESEVGLHSGTVGGTFMS